MRHIQNELGKFTVAVTRIARLTKYSAEFGFRPFAALDESVHFLADRCQPFPVRFFGLLIFSRRFFFDISHCDRYVTVIFASGAPLFKVRRWPRNGLG
jgi:hypothetical protein